jgi:CheY-like chemotaxis protein
MARVLLVDDDADVLDSLEGWLGRKHDVTVAPGLPEALAALARGPIPDIVITDWDLPPFCGDELLRIVASHFPAVCRVLHSGTPRPPGSPSLAQHVLVKGCDLGELERVVDSCAKAA